MDNRLYFVIGDLFSNILVGVVVGCFCWLIVGADWNMWLAMIVMMLVGMLLASMLFFPLGILFGAMEVMLPLMLSGMVSGMIVGMWIPMSPLTLIESSVIGAMSGVLGLLAVWVLNNNIRGKVMLSVEGVDGDGY